MTDKLLNILALLVTAILLFLSPGVMAQVKARAAAPAPAAPAAEAVATELDKDTARGLLDAAKVELEAIPADAAADSPPAARRVAMQRRIALVEEFLGLLAQTAAQAKKRSELSARLEKTRVALDAAPAPESITGINRDGFARLEKDLATLRDRATAMRNNDTRLRRRVEEEIPPLLQELKKRIGEAEKRRELMSRQLATAADEQQRRNLKLMVENAQFDALIANRSIDVQQDEVQIDQEAAPVRAAEMDLVDRELKRSEARFAQASKILESQIAQERAQADAELARKERKAEQATTPVEQFITEHEARLARSDKSRSDAGSLIVTLKNEIADQDKRLATEKSERDALRDLIKRSGTSGRAGERINFTIEQIKRRRTVLKRAFESKLMTALQNYRSRRFDVEDALFGLEDRFLVGRNLIVKDMPETGRKEFTAKSDKLLLLYRDALRAEKSTLTEVISLGQQLHGLYNERLTDLNEHERFIRSRAFWLRDGKPLGPELLESLPQELNNIAHWISRLGSNEMEARLAGVASSSNTILYALFLFPILPAALLWLRQYLRRMTRRINDNVLSDGHSVSRFFATMLTGVGSAAVVPIYFILAGRIVKGAGLPELIEPVVSTVLTHLGAVLFFVFLTRSFFAHRSISEVQFDFPRPVANSFYRALRWFFIAYGVWLIPWLILSNPPFAMQALPRILYALFQVTAAIGVLRLVDPREPFLRHRLESIGPNFICANWSVIRAFIIVVVVVSILLDVIGFQYAARSIGVSLLSSLVVLLVLPPVYAVLAAMVRGVARRVRPAINDAIGDEPEPAQETAERLVGILRIVFMITGIIIVAGAWGLDERALATLDEINVYSTRLPGNLQEVVTAADLVRSVLFMIVTFWVLRILPGLYEFAFFPRMNIDEGVKYALLTISRYGVFIVGIFLALAEIHLDLGRLGWLVAAMGVGLGFGLQEIVSNFVSGIILLVERPVKPGDVVTVGTISGTVQRINIRATTIVNFDRQEVMLPNRSLITSEVTNWTHGDTVNRVVIVIGVAYGSNIELVTETLLKLAGEQPLVLKDPGPSVVFMLHGESSLDFNLRVFVPSPSEIVPVRHALNSSINKAFAELAIEIPFPQRDLHIRSSDIGVNPIPLHSHSVAT